MQSPKLWMLLAALAIASLQNALAKSDPSYSAFPRSTHSNTSSQSIVVEVKKVGKVTNNVQIESASGLKHSASGYMNNSSVVDQGVNIRPLSNLAALVESQNSSTAKREISSSARGANEQSQPSQEPGLESDGSPRGLGLLLQSLILNTVSSTTAATTTTTAAPTLATYSYAMKDMWPLLYSKYCAGTRQSPININTLGAAFDQVLSTSPLIFTNYDAVPIMQVAVNNGLGLQVAQNSAAVPTVGGGGLTGTYSLDHYHFHWGSVSSRGSEHTVNTVRYPMELHLVHFKTDYKSLTASLEHSDGIVVLIILFQTSVQDNAGLLPIVQQIPGINAGQQIATQTYAPSSFLPHRRTDFFKYEGSLTTPPCNEIVTFFVFADTQSISEAQLEQFRSLKDAQGAPLVDNFRNLQPLNGRTVHSSFN